MSRNVSKKTRELVVRCNSGHDNRLGHFECPNCVEEKLDELRARHEAVRGAARRYLNIAHGYVTGTGSIYEDRREDLRKALDAGEEGR